MQQFLPIFPLKLIIYPGQKLNLHIFEDRYKQLIKECIDEKKEFGIPSYIDGHVTEFGTVMKIEKVEKVHETGELDIKTKGVQVFRVLEILKKIPDKMYPGAIVDRGLNFEEANRLPNDIINLVKKTHDLVDMRVDKFDDYNSLNSYDVAAYIGLNLKDQYFFLTMRRDAERRNFIREHLKTMIPKIIETEKMKEKIKANGHFRKEIPPAL